MARPLKLLGAFVGMAVVLGSCSSPEPELRGTDVDAAITEALLPEGIVQVECPGTDTIVPAFGASLDCTGLLAGDPVEVGVDILPVLDGLVTVTSELRTPLFDVAGAAAQAADELAGSLGGDPQVLCPDDRVVLIPGREIVCRVTAAGGTAGPVDRSLSIIVLDAEGAWEIGFLPGS